MHITIVKLFNLLPYSPGRRRLAGWILFLQGVMYAVVHFARLALTTSYQLQEQFLPLLVWAGLFGVMGVAMLLTGGNRVRFGFVGRVCALLAMSLLVGVGVFYFEAGGWTALGWILPVVAVTAGEAFHLVPTAGA